MEDLRGEKSIIAQRRFLCQYESDTLFSKLYQSEAVNYLKLFVATDSRGHSGRVVTLSPPTCEDGVWFPARPQVGKLVVACHWSAVYSTEP